MNIQEAKQEICNALRVYHQTDIAGRSLYPTVRQRPILLMGPPGIGKTAILEQAAREAGMGLVAYTMTHHTRQSAIGLPHIETRIYDGQAVSVTEYTLSEIIASVYDCMERTGKKEGILFIDEINCVSETLAPTMLQFLQNKTFGNHRVPEGWLLVAAGNPPEYNKSVREFDVVTLDRVRRLEIEPDLDVWLDYARAQRLHEAILSYLGIRGEHFYAIHQTAAEKSFVTARGWEDLSALLQGYERLGIPVTQAQIGQYLQHEEAARGFAVYYQLYRKYGADYGIDRLLRGTLDPAEYAAKTAMAKSGGFEERFTVVHLLLDGLDRALSLYVQADQRVTALHEALTQWKSRLSGQTLEDCIASRRQALAVKVRAELLPPAEQAVEAWVLERLEAYSLAVRENHARDTSEAFGLVRGLFSQDVQRRSEAAKTAGSQLERVFQFTEDCFGSGQEMVLLVSSLTRNPRAMAYIRVHGCAPYLRHSEALLFRKEEKQLQAACLELLD